MKQILWVTFIFTHSDPQNLLTVVWNLLNFSVIMISLSNWPPSFPCEVWSPGADDWNGTYSFCRELWRHLFIEQFTYSPYQSKRKLNLLFLVNTLNRFKISHNTGPKFNIKLILQSNLLTSILVHHYCHYQGHYMASCNKSVTTLLHYMASSDNDPPHKRIILSNLCTDSGEDPMLCVMVRKNRIYSS